MKIYTLKETMTGNASCLNGKIFKVKKDEKGRAVFVDIITDQVIWVTTNILEKINTDCGVKFITKRGSIYELVNILSIIPSTPSPKEIKVDEDDVLKVISTEQSSKSINYEDGYDKTVFEFNCTITEDVFIKFLLANGYKIHEQEAWYEDHSVISGEGFKWTYTWVRVYTD